MNELSVSLLRAAATIALVALVDVPAGAQGTIAPPDPQGVLAVSATAQRVSEAPTIDGEVLGDPVWQTAQVITGFVQEQPEEGAPSSERTEVRITYTADTLYIAVVCYDRDPGSIVVSDSRRDAPLDESDSFQVIFDTYQDRLNGFVFGTNPAGIEYDGQVSNEGRGGGGLAQGQRQQSGSGSGFNLNWDGVWQVRARITEIGWTAEFAIPFRSLRFPSGANQTWGVNFQRNIRRRNERAFWAPISRQYNLYRLSLAGALSGLQTPTIRSFLATPYALGNVLESGQRPTEAAVLGDVGVDVKYNLTPSLTFDGTVNTDFAQVEVDDQQVNLDRFELFFPEKRPFFLENAGFFSVGNSGEVDLFFSRRIGISDSGENTTILGGARVSGRTGPYDVGLLNMQTAAVGGTGPANNFSVIRVSRNLPNRSSIGGLFVNRQATGDLAGDGDHNRTYAVDGKWGVGQHTVLSSFMAKTDTPGIRDDDHAYNLRTRTSLPRMDVEVGYQEVGQLFNPEVGFVSRRGYRKADAQIMTRFRPADFIGIHELRPHYTFRSFWGFDGFKETSYQHFDNHWQWRNSYEVHSGMNLTEEGVRRPFEIFPGVIVPPGSYDHAEAVLLFRTNQGAPVSVNVQSTFGGFFGGDRVAFGPSLRMRAGDALTSEVTYQRNNIDLPSGSFVTNLIRTRVSYSFDTQRFVQALVQYNDRADLWSMNVPSAGCRQPTRGSSSSTPTRAGCTTSPIAPSVRTGRWSSSTVGCSMSCGRSPGYDRVRALCS